MNLESYRHNKEKHRNSKIALAILAVSFLASVSPVGADSDLRKRQMTEGTAVISELVPRRGYKINERVDHKLNNVFTEVSKKTTLPAEVVKTIAYKESRYHPEVVNEQTGAIGLFQIMPATADEMKKRGLVVEYQDQRSLLNPEINATFFSANINWLKDYYGVDKVTNRDEMHLLIAGHLLGGRGGRELVTGRRKTSPENELYISDVLVIFDELNDKSAGTHQKIVSLSKQLKF